MSKRAKSTKKKKANASWTVRFRFDDGSTETMSLADHEDVVQAQHHAMARSDDPILRQRGKRLLELSKGSRTTGRIAELEKEQLDRALAERRLRAKLANRKKGDTTRNFVEDRFKVYRDRHRVPEKEIPSKIAADRGLNVGTVKNIIRDLKKAARI